MNGGIARPTRARVLEPLLARDAARRADLAGAVGVREDRPPPLDHRPLDVDRARGAGVGDQLHRRHVVLRPDVVRQRQQPHEVGRHHHRGLGAVAVDRGERALGVEAVPRITDGMPATSSRMPDSGPVWYIGPTTRWVPNWAKPCCLQRLEVLGHRAPAGEHRRRELGPLRQPGGARRVEQVRAGRECRAAAPSAAAPANHSCHGVTPSTLVAAPADDVLDPGFVRAAATPRSAVSGPTNSTRRVESRRMYAVSSAVRWKLTGTVEAPASSPPRWASAVSDRVLGEHRDAPGRPEVHRAQRGWRRG